MSSTRQKKLAAVLATGLLVLGLTGVASATLISTDLITAGDGLITLDTTTGIEWLDVTVTKGVSYNDVMAGYGDFVPQYGFRYATRTEFNELTTGAGIIDDGLSREVYYAAASKLGGLLGTTLQVGLGQEIRMFGGSRRPVTLITTMFQE